MFAVVKYNDYRKEQTFEIIACCQEVEDANKMAFNLCRSSFTNNTIQKIITHEKNHFLHPINKAIVSYRVVEYIPANNNIAGIYSTVYAVLEIANPGFNTLLPEVDSSLLWIRAPLDD